ncbi:hypothetical protein Lesp02_56740 [Lentzea sp. NBRC 105346]|nr:hypothetical protein Lesp02_56740 [Lentzea sp. NBRC 105346]
MAAIAAARCPLARRRLRLASATAAIRCGSLSPVARRPLWLAVRCGSPSAVARRPLWLAVRCGSPSAVARRPLWLAVRSGSPSAVARRPQCSPSAVLAPLAARIQLMPLAIPARFLMRFKRTAGV